MTPTLLVHSRQEPARRLLRLMLEGAGFGCRVLADGDAVLDALEGAGLAVVVVDARDPDEEGLLLLGLLGRRFPTAMRLVLHVGGARLHTATGSEERSWETSEVLGPSPALPSAEELAHAVRHLCAQAQLAVLRPTVGLA